MKAISKIALINALVLVALYVAAEGVYSLIAYFTPSGSVWIAEDAGRTVRFDPVMGHTLSPSPARYARITRGVMQYIGTLQGNAQGFPDRDDFTVERPGPGYRRYAVFGDSFTAGQFLSRNWPDRAEDMFLARGRRIQLLNFSGDGWGPGNWASIIRGLLRQTPYALDGLIFAVWQSDLMRRFANTDLRGRERRAGAMAPSWNPNSHPRTLEQARKGLEGRGPLSSRIVSTEEFNEILKGKPVQEPEWRFALTKRLKEDVYWPAARYVARWLNGDAASDKAPRGRGSRQGPPVRRDQGVRGGKRAANPCCLHLEPRRPLRRCRDGARVPRGDQCLRAAYRRPVRRWQGCFRRRRAQSARAAPAAL